MSELPADVRSLFGGPNYAHVATILPDGAPHTVPVWAGVEGDRIAFIAAPGGRKTRNLALDPRVALSVTELEVPYSMATIRGRAERVEGDRAWEIIDRISQKYIGGPYPLRTNRLVFMVDVEFAWAHDYSGQPEQ